MRPPERVPTASATLRGRHLHQRLGAPEVHFETPPVADVGDEKQEPGRGQDRCGDRGPPREGRLLGLDPLRPGEDGQGRPDEKSRRPDEGPHRRRQNQGQGPPPQEEQELEEREQVGRAIGQDGIIDAELQEVKIGEECDDREAPSVGPEAQQAGDAAYNPDGGDAQYGVQYGESNNNIRVRELRPAERQPEVHHERGEEPLHVVGVQTWPEHRAAGIPGPGGVDLPVPAQSPCDADPLPPDLGGQHDSQDRCDEQAVRPKAATALRSDRGCCHGALGTHNRSHVLHAYQIGPPSQPIPVDPSPERRSNRDSPDVH